MAVLLTPPILAICILIWTLFWAFGATYIYSVGTFKKSTG